jgi:tetratricopeptide (TPR) repeat protein
VSPVRRVRLIVGLLALAAGASVIGVVLVTGQDPKQPKAQCTQPPKPLLVPGVTSARQQLVVALMTRPPRAAAEALEPVAQAAPNDPVVQFNDGVALFCAGFLDEAQRAFRAAKQGGRDTLYEMRADEILHPQFFAPQDGLYPLFEPAGSTDPLLLRGVVLQREGHQHSAERLYARAARLRPRSDEAHVAAAVGLFDEDNLSASFSRLGPLVRTFPRSQSVRYHLGLLLAWTGQREQATTEFRLARALGPKTLLGRGAATFLGGLVPDGTKTTKK